MDLKGRNFLTLKDFTAEEIIYLVDLAAEHTSTTPLQIFQMSHQGRKVQLRKSSRNSVSVVSIRSSQ